MHCSFQNRDSRFYLRFADYFYIPFSLSGYVQSSDPADSWKDKGTGQLTIRCKEGVSKGTKESKPTVIVRNDVCFLSRHLWFQIYDWCEIVVDTFDCISFNLLLPLLNVGFRCGMRN